MIKKIQHILVALFLFLLPWQTRYIWREGVLGGGYWEYGTISLYATEILLWSMVILFFFSVILKLNISVQIFGKKKKNIIIVCVIGLAGLFVSMVTSGLFLVSAQYVVRILAACLVILLLARSISSERVVYITALWCGGVLQGGLAIYQFLQQHIFSNKWLGMAAQHAQDGGASVVEFGIDRWLRAYGSFGSPNSLGIYLAVLLVLGLLLYLRTISGAGKIYIAIGQIFIASGLALSFSRGAWIAAVIGFICAGVVVRMRQQSETWGFYKHIAYIFFSVVFWVILFFPVFQARFNPHNRLEARSISERREQYHDAMIFFFKRPFFGVGPGMYTYTIYQHYPQLPYWQYQPVHNIYILLIVESGVFIAAVLAMLCFFLIKNIYTYNIMYLPAVITTMVAGMFDHWLVSMYTGMIFLAVALSLGVIVEVETAEDRGLIVEK